MDIQTCTCAHTYIFIFRTQKGVDNLHPKLEHQSECLPFGILPTPSSLLCISREFI